MKFTFGFAYERKGENHFSDFLNEATVKHFPGLHRKGNDLFTFMRNFTLTYNMEPQPLWVSFFTCAVNTHLNCSTQRQGYQRKIKFSDTQYFCVCDVNTFQTAFRRSASASVCQSMNQTSKFNPTKPSLFTHLLLNNDTVHSSAEFILTLLQSHMVRELLPHSFSVCKIHFLSFNALGFCL